METQELLEMQEQSRERHQRVVGVTTAVVAAFLAAVTLMSHRLHTEEVVMQTKAADGWAYYQAKNIRRHEDEIVAEVTSVQPTTDATALAKVREKYASEAARYKDDQKEIEDKAREMEAEVDTERNRANRYDLAEVFLEVGLVITSITLLSGRRLFWLAGIVLAVIGLGLAVTGFFVH